VTPSPIERPEPTEMRLDELARRAGVASTTVRLYRAKGLLDPPRLQGRTGWYDDGHLRRLALIARLQDDGFSLAGIATLLERWRDGQSLEGLAGVEHQLEQLLGTPHAATFAPDELLDRFPAEAMTPNLMQRAAALGLIGATDDGRIAVTDVRFLDAGAALARLGVPLGDVLDEWERLRAQTDDVARRFVDLFEQHLAPDGWRDGLDDATAAGLASTLGSLHELARLVVVAALDTSLAAAGRARLGDLLDDRSPG